jgi:hypothetical protein
LGYLSAIDNSVFSSIVIEFRVCPLLSFAVSDWMTYSPSTTPEVRRFAAKLGFKRTAANNNKTTKPQKPSFTHHHLLSSDLLVAIVCVSF